jgi:hypothetical protein
VRKLKATVLQALADKCIGLAQYLLKDGNGVLGCSEPIQRLAVDGVTEEGKRLIAKEAH